MKLSSSGGPAGPHHQHSSYANNSYASTMSPTLTGQSRKERFQEQLKSLQNDISQLSQKLVHHSPGSAVAKGLQGTAGATASGAAAALSSSSQLSNGFGGSVYLGIDMYFTNHIYVRLRQPQC
jgi:UDP-N-acetylmuramyl tripeptide synthase